VVGIDRKLPQHFHLGERIQIFEGSQAQQGLAAANWIRTGSTYEFRFYDSDHTRLLDKLVVTRETQ
jgi:hypothetical protein